MDPTQTLPLLPCRERDGVCAENAGLGAGRWEATASIQSHLSRPKGFPLSFTDGRASPPISGRERKAKWNTVGGRDTSVSA